MTILSRLIAALALVGACGSDDGGSTPDAPPRADAMVAAPAPYGVCRMGVPADCPANHTCQIRNVTGGSTTMGYCSPPCATNPDCLVGFPGPGDPVCFMPDACVIVCTGTCPTGLACLAPGGPVDVCVVAE